jgi:hypothetical protein
MKIQTDEVLGEIKGKIPTYKSGFDEDGFIIVCEKGLYIKTAGESVRAPYNYVKKITSGKEMPMGRVAVDMTVFDHLGSQYDLSFAITDTHLAALKKACGR